MSARDVENDAPRFRAARIAIKVVAVAALSVCGAVAVWIIGLDWWWAAATVVAFGLAGVAFAGLKFEDHPSWDPPGREAPRGVRLTIPTMEESLSAADRLARPLIARRLRAVVIEERADRLARGTIVRQVRALLLAELLAHGIDPANQTDEAVVALLGPDALAILQPNDDTPVTTAVIMNCLDAVEHLNTNTNAL